MAGGAKPDLLRRSEFRNEVFFTDTKYNNDSVTQGGVRAGSDRGLQKYGERSDQKRSGATEGSATREYGERSDQKRSVAPLGSAARLDVVQSERTTFWKGGLSTLYYNIAPKS